MIRYEVGDWVYFRLYNVDTLYLYTITKVNHRDTAGNHNFDNFNISYHLAEDRFSSTYITSYGIHFIPVFRQLEIFPL